MPADGDHPSHQAQSEEHPRVGQPCGAWGKQRASWRRRRLEALDGRGTCGDQRGDVSTWRFHADRVDFDS